MELRCNLGWTGCCWDVTWIKVRQKYQDLHLGEIWPGWGWDVKLRDLERNQIGHKLGWALHLQTWMGIRWYLDEIDLQTLRDGWIETRPGRRWDTNIGTRMEVRCEPSDPDGSQMVHGRKWHVYWNLVSDETGPAWSWDGGCLNLRCNFADLDGGEMHVFNPGWASDGAWVELRCNLWTWMKMKCRQDGGKMEI